MGRTPNIARLNNLTISENEALAVGWSSHPGGRGGGVYAANSQAYIYQVIIAGNQAYELEPEVFGSLIPSGVNLILTCGSSCYVSGGTLITGQNPQLSPRADYGGGHETYRPAMTSPAVDAGDPTCLDSLGVLNNKDQRQKPRPVDGNADGIVACDLGAVELDLKYVYLPMMIR